MKIIYDIKNKIIIIGGAHHNTLGVIRSFGELGIKPYLIMFDGYNSWVSKSKYIKQEWLIDKDNQQLLNILHNEFENEELKPIIITTSDYTASIIDKNLDNLKEKFICQNINNEQGAILKLMEKKTMVDLAQKSGLLVPKTWSISLNEGVNFLPEDLTYPCIIKPLQSIDGKKDDITVCYSQKEFGEAVNIMKLKYSKVLIQQFIKKEFELGVLGCITRKGIVAPCVIRKIREFPTGKGSASYGCVTRNKEQYINVQAMEKFLISTQYYGIFDMEFIYCNGKTYFIENNFRNGGNGYALIRAGINYIYIWCLDAVGIDIRGYCHRIKEKYFMVETRDIIHVKHREISIRSWLKDLLKVNVFMIANLRDIKPILFWIKNIFK